MKYLVSLLILASFNFTHARDIELKVPAVPIDAKSWPSYIDNIISYVYDLDQFCLSSSNVLVTIERKLYCRGMDYEQTLCVDAEVVKFKADPNIPANDYSVLLSKAQSCD